MQAPTDLPGTYELVIKAESFTSRGGLTVAVKLGLRGRTERPPGLSVASFASVSGNYTRGLASGAHDVEPRRRRHPPRTPRPVPPWPETRVHERLPLPSKGPITLMHYSG